MVILPKQVMFLYSMFNIHSTTKLFKLSLPFIAISNFGMASHVRKLRQIHQQLLSRKICTFFFEDHLSLPVKNVYCSHAVSQQIMIWICTGDHNSLPISHVLNTASTACTEMYAAHSAALLAWSMCKVILLCKLHKESFTFNSRNQQFQQRTQILWFVMYSLHQFLRSCTEVSWTTWKFWNTNICLMFPLSPNYVLFKKNISLGARITVATNSWTAFSTGSCSSVWQTALVLFQLCA